MPILITPSILAADLGNLQKEVESVATAGADWLQIDVMDGHFVPNLSFGAPVIRHLQTSLPLDIHLMVTNPGDRLDEFLKLKVANITFHAEAVRETKDRKAIIDQIHKGGATAGIAINPNTDVAAIEDILSSVDLVLVMSVEPGFSAQQFIADVLPKVRDIRARFPSLMIQMDGGIDTVTAPLCREAGATNLVSGNYIFSSPDRAAAISTLRG